MGVDPSAQARMAPSLTCSYCLRTFDTSMAKKVHEQQVHVFVFKCTTCATKFASERNLTRHMAKCTSTPGPVLHTRTTKTFKTTTLRRVVASKEKKEVVKEEVKIVEVVESEKTVNPEVAKQRALIEEVFNNARAQAETQQGMGKVNKTEETKTAKTMKEPKIAPVQISDAGWETAKKKANMLSSMKKKEELLKQKLAELKTKVDMKSTVSLKEETVQKLKTATVVNEVETSMPKDLVITRVLKKAHTEIKSEVKEVEHDPIYLEMVKKAEMLEEIKMKEQNLIEKLAVMKKKKAKNIEVKEESNDTSVTKINLTQEPSKEKAVTAPVLMTREQKLARIRELKEQQKQILEKHKLEEKRIKQEEEERIQKEKEERLQTDEEDRVEKEEDRITKEEKDRIKKQEEDRIKKEEEDRIKKEEEVRIKKEEEDRIEKEEEERIKKEKEDKIKKEQKDRIKKDVEDRKKENE